MWLFRIWEASGLGTRETNEQSSPTGNNNSDWGSIPWLSDTEFLWEESKHCGITSAAWWADPGSICSPLWHPPMPHLESVYGSPLKPECSLGSSTCIYDQLLMVTTDNRQLPFSWFCYRILLAIISAVLIIAITSSGHCIITLPRKVMLVWMLQKSYRVLTSSASVTLSEEFPTADPSKTHVHTF